MERVALCLALNCALMAAVPAAAAAASMPAAERRSGADVMGPELRAMQDDDAANPAGLWLLDGQALWDRKVGRAAKSCAECHGTVEASMTGVAGRYPALVHGRLVDLEQRINLCRTARQQAPPLAWEGHDLLALSALLARASRGLPISPSASPALRPFLVTGRRIFLRRQGQLNLSCAECHDDNWGRHLGGAVIPQGHPTGYPLYRLEWQSLGSLQRRLRNCMAGMRAEPYPYGAKQAVSLELYLMWRARGMRIDAPAVRP
jgi:sulfur-oxidizing protein SoxA